MGPVRSGSGPGVAIRSGSDPGAFQSGRVGFGHKKSSRFGFGCKKLYPCRTLPHAHPLPLSQSYKNFDNCRNSIILSKNLLEIRQICRNSTRILTCFKILLQLGHCRNSDGEMLIVEIIQNQKMSAMALIVVEKMKIH